MRCFKYNLDSSIHTSPDLNSYDFNQTVNFSCDDDQILYGPSSARCTQNGWEYNGPSWPVCGSKWAGFLLYLNGNYFSMNYVNVLDNYVDMQEKCNQNFKKNSESINKCPHVTSNMSDATYLY